MSEVQHSPRFRVIVVGGAIAGLTLAHCLGREDIDFVVLESHSNVSPQVGASVGILANGFRVLDQLGLFDDLFNAVEPLAVSAIWTADGKPLFSNTAPKVLYERHGYPFSFLNRRTLLAALYRHLGKLQDRILVNKKVTKVKHLKDSVTVECSDGSSYTGDLLVGADGVHSTVRQEMWRTMIDMGMKKAVQEEESRMSSEYSCVFGVSTPTPGLQPGDCHRTFADKFSFLTVAGKEGEVYWFLFAKMDNIYSMKTMPKFTSEQRDAHIAQYMDRYVAEGVTFGSIYERVISSTYVPIEEAFFDHWFCERIVCIGDAVHKMTPNMGQGANSAIESAASLTNYLSQAVKSAGSDTQPSIQDLRYFLLQWQKSRQPRAKEVWQGANDFTRLEAFASPFHKILAHYLMPLMGDKAIDMTSAMLVGGEIIESLDVPDRSLNCSIPYNPRLERLKDEVRVRTLLATPLLLCAGAAWYSGFFSLKSVPSNLTTSMHSISQSDNRQAIKYLLSYGITTSIWTMESYRYAISFTPMALSTFYTILSHFKGTDKVVPLYFFIYFLAFPISNLILGPGRQVNVLATRFVLPILVCTFGIPLLITYATTSPTVRLWSIQMWHLFPIFVFIAPQVLKRWIVDKPNPSLSSSSSSTYFDLSKLRILYASLAFVASTISLWLTVTSSEAKSDMSYQLRATVARIFPGSSASVSDELERATLFTQASTFIFLILSLRDARRFGIALSYGVAIASLATLTLFLGPEAAIVTAWAVREEVLVKLSQR